MEDQDELIELAEVSDRAKRLFTFGKHKGKSVIEVMSFDPQYILWVEANVKFFEIFADEYKYCRDAAETEDRLYDDMMVGAYYDEFWKD